MASYVYNPSKKVTELLSQYLEFDREKLKLGVWSGRLALRDVQLRAEAFDPIINLLQSQSEQPSPSSTTTPTPPSPEDAATFTKPPLRFKLVSGTLGMLNLRIPWKRLVWGQGDVKVKMRNVVITLAVETQEDRDERDNKDNGGTDETDGSGGGKTLFSLFADDSDDDQSTSSESSAPPVPDELSVRPGNRKDRQKKQRRIRESERLLLQGNDLAPWLRAVRKKEREERAKKAAAEAEEKEKREGLLMRWLKDATSDFFWRFYAGLHADIENVKIAVIQDGIEVGVTLPSFRVCAPDSSTTGKTHPQQQQRTPGPGRPATSDHDHQSSDEGDGAGSIHAPPEQVVYEGEHEDGEHIDKRLSFTGFGAHVRKVSSDLAADIKFPMDISMYDYILRPADMSCTFSLFYPYPPEKRKREHQHALDGRTNPSREDSGEISTTSSKKRRRGKRDKQPTTPPQNETATDITELTSSGMPSTTALSPIPHHQRTKTPVTFEGLSPAKLVKSSSVGMTPENRKRRDLMGSLTRTASASESRHSRHLTEASLPLVVPEDIGTVFKTASCTTLTVRFDGKVEVCAVRVSCSTRHYQLLNAFTAACARVRNGRPSKAIRSVIDPTHTLTRRRSVTVETMDDIGVPGLQVAHHRKLKLSLDLPLVRSELSDVVRSWWRYVLGVIAWEIRQRKKLRKYFQDNYLSFSWSRQKYKRREYVNLYIANRLNPQRTLIGSSEDELIRLEDELNIEQILLYRAIARAVRVRGLAEMPESILDIISDHDSLAHDKDREDEDVSQRAVHPSNPIEDTPTTLSSVQHSFDLLRKKRDSDNGDFAALKLRAPLCQSGVMGVQTIDIDEVTGLGADRTVQTYGSAATPFATSAMEGGGQIDDTSVVFSFSFKMERLEFMLIKEEFFFDGINETYPELGADDRSSGTAEEEDNMSPLSILTDDFGGIGVVGRGKEEEDDPAVVSSDYQFLKMPQETLLCVVLIRLPVLWLVLVVALEISTLSWVESVSKG